MRYIIYGAGAVGGVVGARLLECGKDVVLIARGDHLEAIRREGLTLTHYKGRTTVRPEAVSHPSEIEFRDDDVVLLTMKTQDTAAALEALEAAAGSDVPVFCCQNGVVNERMAARRFSQVYGVYVTIFATYLTPGAVEAAARPVFGILDAGRFPDGEDDRCHEFAADLGAAAISSQPRDQVMRWKHGKLLTNLAGSLAAICSKDEDTSGLASAVRAEGVAVLKAAGIEHVGAPDQKARREDAGMQVGPMSGGSVWQSVARRVGSVESDYLNGEIVLQGRLHGVPTPYNEAVRQLTNGLSRSHGTPASVPVATVERLVEAIADGRQRVL
jgi:2-dehydropantoate 2-reductase